MTRVLTQAVDLPVFSLPQGDFEPRLVMLLAQHFHLGRLRTLAVDVDALLPAP
jgi:hypothetical protein